MNLPYRQTEIDAYIYGSKQLTNMVQSDLQMLQEDSYLQGVGDRPGYLIIFGNDEIE